MNRLFPALHRCLADRRLHEFLWYCVPGVLTGLVLRAWLMIVWPYGYYHPDTHDFLTTIYVLKAHHHFSVHGKTTFLTPVLYTIPFLLHIPALLLIPLAQHLRGLLLILFVGGLARLWFTFWRWLIIPLTMLAALQPGMIFWEHTLMSESGFVFCAVTLALAGTGFVVRPSWWTFGGVLAAMFFVAAARPEGNLLLGTGVLLPIFVYWGRWREAALHASAAILLMLGMLSITKVSHSGLLLYSSVVHLTPDTPRTVPGLGPYIQPLRDRMRERRAQAVSHDVVRTAKRISEVLIAYAAANPRLLDGVVPPKSRRGGTSAEPDLRGGTRMSDLCRKLAVECMLAHPWQLPVLAVHKFLATIRQDSGGVFADYPFHAKQAKSLLGKPEIAAVIGPGLLGSPLETPGQAEAFVDAHYPIGPVAWFNSLEAAWLAGVNYLHLPDIPYSPTFVLPGLPIYYLLALLGGLAALAGPAELRPLQWAFLPVLGAMWFLVTLTAEVIPRHRFVLEPFWLLYSFNLLDAGLRLFTGRAQPPVPVRINRRDP